MFHLQLVGIQTDRERDTLNTVVHVTFVDVFESFSMVINSIFRCTRRGGGGRRGKGKIRFLLLKAITVIASSFLFSVQLLKLIFTILRVANHKEEEQTHTFFEHQVHIIECVCVSLRTIIHVIQRKGTVYVEKTIKLKVVV